MRTFFTADTHFGHANIIRYTARPFKDVDEMDRVLIENWNSVVSKEDIVYHLGDFSFGPATKYMTQLNGIKCFVRGNHEKPLLNLVNVRDVPNIRSVKIEGYPEIVLCHFAMRVWNKSHFDSWHLYGHSHGTLEGQGKSIDVGVDTRHLYKHKKYTPYSIEEIDEIMRTRPNNFNYLKRLPGYNNVEFEKARYEEE